MSDNRQTDYSEGRLMSLINKTGNSLLLNILFLVCSLPLVTFGASLSAYYYAMVKTVRCERSYPAGEFFKAFKRNIIKGSVYTIVIAAIGVLFFINREYCIYNVSRYSVMMVAAYDVLIAFLAIFVIWIFPVISRFDVDVKRTVLLTFNIAVRRFHFTLALAALIAATVFLCLKLSVGFGLVIPAAACYLSAYMIEPAFKSFIPAPQDNEDPWYYTGQ